MIHGSCLCGGVKYRISGRVGPMSHCHCSMCRKAHGAAFASYARADAANFAIVEGTELVRTFASSSGVERTFCERCGANLQFLEAQQPDKVWIAAGTFDDDPVVRATYHLYTASRAPWFEITDTLPQHGEAAPPAG